MSVATQITRLQGVRDHIRTKMVGLGLSSNTDLLQDLADDLDGVNKVSPTNNGATDPGSSYTNVDTLSRSTSTRYIKVPKGYNDADRKFTVSGVANGSVSSATTTSPGDSYTNQTTVTPSTSAQYVKVTAGYLPNSKITVNAIPSPYYNTSGVTATADTVLKDYKFVNSSGTTVTGTISTADSSNVSGSVSGDNPGKITLTAAKTSGSSSTTATAKAIVTKGLYTGSSNIEKSLDSKTFTATAEAKLANTNGAIELTAGTSAFTKTSTADYSNGFITSVKVNPTPSDAKEFTPTIAGGTVSPDAGRLLSSVTVKGVPSFSVAFTSASWSSDSNTTIGKYFATVSDNHITADNNLYVIPRSASDTTAAQSFGIYAYSQSNGSMQFRAVAKPTSTVTYTVYYLSQGESK